MTASGEGLRFLLFGAFNTGLTYAAYCLLVGVLPAQAAYALVFAAGIVLAWFGNSRLVFRRPVRTRQAVAYPLLYLVQYALTALLIHGLMQGLGCGPRLALANALVFTTPLAFLWHRRLLVGGSPADSLLWTAWGVGVVVLAGHSIGLAGFWQGDDVANLFTMYQAAERGELLAFVANQFHSPVPSAGAFYRPMMMASLAAQYALAGADYPSWYALNLAVHAANALLVFVLLHAFSRDSRSADPLAALWIPAWAALFFGLSPLIGEGVFWVSARSDGWVTLGSLVLTGCFLFGARWPRAAMGLGALFTLVALGFKESAVLLPGVLILLALATSRRLDAHQKFLIVFTIVAAFALLATRAWLFGQVWNAYLPGAAPQAGALEKFAAGWRSLLPWWNGLMRDAPLAAAIGAMAAALPWIAALFAAGGKACRTSVAFALAALGTVSVTIANLGALSGQGEGGRLFYGALAWAVLSMGVALQSGLAGRATQLRRACIASMLAALLAHSAVLSLQWRHVADARGQLRAVAAAIGEWANRQSGQTILVVPDHAGSVVLARNAQAGLVLPPIQPTPLLNRVSPTLPAELGERARQYCNGLGTQLDRLGSRVPGSEDFKRLLDPAHPAAPAAVACWQPALRAIVLLHRTTPGEACDAWLAAVVPRLRRCDWSDGPEGKP
jgi:putative flippase GtrA